MIQWYYADAQRQRHGPVEDRDIRALYQRGELNAQTLVWREGLSEWASLESLSEELALHTTAPAATGGIDLRADLAAIANGTAPLPGTGGGTHSPYAASSTAMGSGHGAVHGDGPVVHAGLWRRVAAWLVDTALIQSVIMASISPFLLFTTLPKSPEINGAAIVALIAISVIFTILTPIYYGRMHSSKYMATIGKMLIGIKVCRSNGSQIGFARGISRYIIHSAYQTLITVAASATVGALIFSITLAAGTLIYASILVFSQNKQALHDMICDTIVVDRWAFTDQPELQREGLGTVTIVILSLFALLIVGGIVLAVVAGAALASMGG